jgi:hypothetical protein
MGGSDEEEFNDDPGMRKALGEAPYIADIIFTHCVACVVFVCFYVFCFQLQCDSIL